MKKESKEWIHSWCDDTNNRDLPRVLLIGDSITYGYQAKVRELLKGVCYVDYLATSYAVDMPIYNKLVETMAFDSDYDLVHFNHGLHGIHMSKRTYKSRLKKLLSKLERKMKIMVAKTTFVYQAGNKRKDAAWMKRVLERNEAMEELAAEKGYAVDDLYEVSVKMPVEKRYQDGTHYLEDGYEILAQTVAAKIKEIIK